MPHRRPSCVHARIDWNDPHSHFRKRQDSPRARKRGSVVCSRGRPVVDDPKDSHRQLTGTRGRIGGMRTSPPLSQLRQSDHPTTSSSIWHTWGCLVYRVLAMNRLANEGDICIRSYRRGHGWPWRSLGAASKSALCPRITTRLRDRPGRFGRLRSRQALIACYLVIQSDCRGQWVAISCVGWRGVRRQHQTFSGRRQIQPLSA